jgi:hypothetical protein
VEKVVVLTATRGLGGADFGKLRGPSDGRAQSCGCRAAVPKTGIPPGEGPFVNRPEGCSGAQLDIGYAAG